MAKAFISYSRKDQAQAASLCQDIKDLGNDVWFDQDLSGGQEWWEKILESVRECEVFIFVLSVDSMSSLACKREYKYAEALGKTILPVLVGSVNESLLPPALSKIQFVDYRSTDRGVVLRLARALNTAPVSLPLPDSLPMPPKVPLSYLGSLAEKIETTSSLSFEQQSGLIFDLKRSLRDSEVSNEGSILLLSKLRSREDLFAKIADEIDKLTLVSIQSSLQSKDDGRGSRNKVSSGSEVKEPPLKKTISVSKDKALNFKSFVASEFTGGKTAFVNMKRRILSRVPIGVIIGAAFAFLVHVMGQSDLISLMDIDRYSHYLRVDSGYFWLTVGWSCAAFAVLAVFYSNVSWKNSLIIISGVIFFLIVHDNFATSYTSRVYLELYGVILPVILALVIAVPVIFLALKRSLSKQSPRTVGNE